ncbi:unnamed protein product [Diatraea saccharalis]|uniref:Uncharacterized protein n=1 Tax=Diatraea saccharalis TaxID=40085 RepID=A0A9N9RDM5_9NEOP|nr:unnamed protein product [Diatraea saccharalis]
MIPTAPLPQPHVAMPVPAVGSVPSNATALRNGRDPLTNKVPSITFSDATARPLGPMGEMLVTTRGLLEPIVRPPRLKLTPVNPVLRPRPVPIIPVFARPAPTTPALPKPVPIRPVLPVPITPTPLPRPAPTRPAALEMPVPITPTPLPRPAPNRLALPIPVLATPTELIPVLDTNVYSQFGSLNYGGFLGDTGVDFTATAASSGLAGLSGYLENGGLYNNGLALNTLGLGGLGVNNLGLGLGNVGVTAAGLENIGVAGLGVGNIGLGLGNAGLAVGGLNNAGLGIAGLGYGAGLGVQNVAATSQVPVTGPFTASGNAELVVGGDFGVGGQAVVGGQIPVLGAVGFSGQIPASGVVSIAGNCGCSTVPL